MGPAIRLQSAKSALGRVWFLALMAAVVAAAPAMLAAQASNSDLGPVVALLRQHKDQQALTGLDHLLTQSPQDCRLLSLRGIALNGLKQPEEADKAFRKALGYCPTDLMALEGAAEIEYAQKKPGAPALLRRILALRPEDVTSHAMLASLEAKEGKCKAALPHFEASKALFPSRPGFEQSYGFCLAKTGQYEQAEAVFQSLLKTAPEPATRYNLALVQWRKGDAKSALETLRPMLTADATEAVLSLGSRVAEEAGDTPLAVKLLRSNIVAHPKNPDNYLEFAQLSFNHHSFQVGIDMLNAGLTQLPDAGPLYLARGVLEVQLSKSAQAVADFEKAHQLAPQLSLAMDAMGMMKSQELKSAAALDIFRKQAKLHPKDALLQYLYAEALSETAADAATSQQAIEAARRSVAADSGYGPARNLLAKLLLRAGHPQEALEQAQAALKIRPDDDGALYQEIMARRRLGQKEQVKALVKQLTAMKRKNAQKEQASHRYVLKEEPGS